MGLYMNSTRTPQTVARSGNEVLLSGGTAKKPKIHVELTALWGNDDAESTIKISPLRWKRIQEGAEFETSAWGWYEGKRFSVRWYFSNGEFSIYDHIADCPIEELIVQDSESV